VVEIILNALVSASKVLAVATLKLGRFGITNKALKLIEKLNILFVIMPPDKTTALNFYNSHLKEMYSQ
jgi:indolepyruvate decarboxylase